jgi:hydroxymethylpyrimidine pyrophosphatase-like HAD family hydrolase
VSEHWGLVLACDIDDTLLAVGSRSQESQEASEQALQALCVLVERERAASDQPLYFGSVTGRTLVSHQEREQQSPAFAAAAAIMDFKVTSVGSEAYICTGGGFTRLPNWPDVSGWDREKAEDVLSRRRELRLQAPIAQGTHKLSFDVEGVTTGHAAYVAEITGRLAEASIPAEVLFSGDRFLDILPQGVNKGTGLLRTIGALTLAVQHTGARPPVVAAGDSMNDCAPLQEADLAILPGNAHDDLRQWARGALAPGRLYVAEGNFAAGIIEGYYHFAQSR